MQKALPCIPRRPVLCTAVLALICSSPLCAAEIPDWENEQVIGRNKVIMRWLSHRGGALDFKEWCEAHPGERFPVAVALGAAVGAGLCAAGALILLVPTRSLLVSFTALFFVVGLWRFEFE